MAFQLKVNGQAHAVDADNDTPLLWVCAKISASRAPSSDAG
jgi:aerobic-type carbon monoxide dehydrogenase small subunit (CoxS/CutS family)